MDDSESRSRLVISVSATLVCISTLVFGLRLYTRCILLRTAGADDWTMLVAQLMAIACSVATCIEGMFGLGRHIQTLTEKNIQMVFIFLFITIFTYNLGLNIVKISFLLQYRRIFPNPILRTICRWGLIIIPIWTVIQQVILSLTCTPLDLIVPSTETWCLETLNIWVSTSTMSLITDFAIFLLPIPLVWDLRIPLRQKLLVFGIFGLGLVVCVISIIRVPTLRAAAGATDPTYDNISASLWTIAEINAAIICSSLPILRPLLFHVSSSLTTMTKRTMTRTTSAPAEFPPNHLGHQLEDLPNHYPHHHHHQDKNLMMMNGGVVVAAAAAVVGLSGKETNTSSDDLVSATYDEMIYGGRGPRQSTIGGGGRRQPSFHAKRASDGDVSVDLGA